ncbi:hypothetical protein [Halostreptopolyspora alba]
MSWSSLPNTESDDSYKINDVGEAAVHADTVPGWRRGGGIA